MEWIKPTKFMRWGLATNQHEMYFMLIAEVVPAFETFGRFVKCLEIIGLALGSCAVSHNLQKNVFNEMY